MSIKQILAAVASLALAGGAWAAGADLGNTQQQATNWTAIVMFGLFVAASMFIVKKWHEANQRHFDSAGLLSPPALANNRNTTL